MLPFINPELPCAEIASKLAAQDYVVIKDFLAPAVASHLQQLMLQQPWDLAFSQSRKGQILRAADIAKNPQREQQASAQAWAEQESFRFSYHNIDLVKACIEKRPVAPDLIALLEIFNTPAYHALMAQLTGCSDFTRISAQATWYRPGDFLTLHNDFVHEEQRFFAYVLSLSDRWQASYGGLLHLFDEQGNERAKVVPQFNCLTLFKTPQQHLVSKVIDNTAGARLAITGWLSKPNPVSNSQ
ncbi:2OG-Fe(II) oxygenase [Simiduia aestuariiviva]|uniref:SM-20-related protein n=1 Tax=Simiduia aestuariiviva TaxID=1510459 RepID=A0A839UUG2_9GAMM|nr:2OG-Fe(II) oxygenase family protein [Simiduia aestuariiviva]MBB3169626.1 SM-20-related protein [Simiduia aestuariiviva]